MVKTAVRALSEVTVEWSGCMSVGENGGGAGFA